MCGAVTDPINGNNNDIIAGGYCYTLARRNLINQQMTLLNSFSHLIKKINSTKFKYEFKKKMCSAVRLAIKKYNFVLDFSNHYIIIEFRIYKLYFNASI